MSRPCLDEVGLSKNACCPRAPFFSGKDQLFWECSESRLCETGPTNGHTLKPLLTDDLHLLERQGKLSESDLKRLRQSWSSAAEHYSRCLLTVQTDKLVALAGIAKSVANATQDEYLFGLWKSSFVENLLWTGDPSVSRSSFRNKEYLAPSYSWASSNGPINMERASWTMGSRAQVGLEFASDMRLRINACLKECRIEKEFAEALAYSICYHNEIQQVKNFNEAGDFVSLDYNDLMKDGVSANMFYSLVAEIPWDWHTMYSFLLLVHCGAGVYERVGMIETHEHGLQGHNDKV